jgi:hypothetical protein
MALVDLLNGIRDGLSAQLTSSSSTPAPGALVTAAVSPVPETIDVTDVIDGSLDLVWVGKDVMFAGADLEPSFATAALDAATIGPKPITGATGIIGGISGTPGLLGQLKGTVPLISRGQFPISLHVHWHVLDGNRNELASSEFSAPAGLDGASIAVAFMPETTELTDGPAPSPRTRFLRAEVTLSAGTATTASRQLPDIPVLVPALPIPTVLALFLHANFEARSGDDDGAVLVVVPESSPLRSAGQLQGVLNTLESVIGNLTSFGGFAAFLLGLKDLVQALSVQPHVQFRAANEIDNLNDITLIPRPWYENDTEAEDELSSLILIGRERRGAKCCNARDRHDDEGQFTVRTTANLFVVVRNFDGKHPTGEGGTITVDKEPPGGFRVPDKFNDELSSIEFV